MRTAARVGSGLHDKADKVRQGVADMQLVCKIGESVWCRGTCLNSPITYLKHVFISRVAKVNREGLAAYSVDIDTVCIMFVKHGHNIRHFF
jgi:hypothetical protein